MELNNHTFNIYNSHEFVLETNTGLIGLQFQLGRDRFPSS